MSPRERSLKNKEVKRNEFAIYWSQKKLTYIYNRRVFFWKINFNAVDFVWFFLVSENYSSRLLVPIRLSIILYDGERQKNENEARLVTTWTNAQKFEYRSYVNFSKIRAKNTSRGNLKKFKCNGK